MLTDEQQMTTLAAPPDVKLTSDQIDRFRTDGYIAFPQFLCTSEVAEARSALSEMAQRFHRAAVEGKCDYRPAKPGGTGNYDGAHIHFADRKAFLAFEPGIDPLSMTSAEAEAVVRNVYAFTEEAPIFGRLVAHQKIQGVCARLLGEQVTDFASMALSKPARIGGEKPWHQDNAYFKWVPLELVIGCWIALDDAGVENGCMHVLPGEHRRGALKHIHTFDCHIAPDRMSPRKPVPVPLPSGGAMFFSCLLPHQTPPNRSDQRRRALQFHYRGISTHAAEPEEYNRIFAEQDGTPASCAASAPAR
jgi:phytanoyl-CoA hydroxylase